MKYRGASLDVTVPRRTTHANHEKAGVTLIAGTFLYGLELERNVREEETKIHEQGKPRFDMTV